MQATKAKCIGGNVSAGPLRPLTGIDRDIWCPMDGLHLNSLHSSLDCWWTIERGIDRQPEMDRSPYRLDCTDHFRTAQDRTIDFLDTTRLSLTTIFVSALLAIASTGPVPTTRTCNGSSSASSRLIEIAEFAALTLPE